MVYQFLACSAILSQSAFTVSSKVGKWPIQEERFESHICLLPLAPSPQPSLSPLHWLVNSYRYVYVCLIEWPLCGKQT